jgi:hypothetical protein
LFNSLDHNVGEKSVTATLIVLRPMVGWHQRLCQQPGWVGPALRLNAAYGPGIVAWPER